MMKCGFIFDATWLPVSAWIYVYKDDCFQHDCNMPHFAR